jgi:arginase
MRRLSVVDAPSNLGLSPPAPGAVPGVYKLGWALREAGVATRLHAADRGVVIPPRYESRKAEGTILNEVALAGYSRKLADRVAPLVRSGEWTLVLGGDCSILLGTMLALRRLGRYGLVFVDGHSDFRHPGNSATAGPVGAAAGEDLALVTGRGPPALIDLEGRAPLVRDEDVVVVGPRPDDPCRDEVRGSRLQLIEAPEVRAAGAAATGRRVAEGMGRRAVSGFWVHLDADVVDPGLLPAVDAPAPGGLTFEELGGLLRELAASPLSVGLEVTVFDPDRDAEGRLAGRLADTLVAALSTSR